VAADEVDDVADGVDRDEGNVAVLNELLVEEVSIDGMCGVY
jgi:mycofactocin precursor